MLALQGLESYTVLVLGFRDGRVVQEAGIWSRWICLLLTWEGIDLQLCFRRWREEHGLEQSLNYCRLIR